MNQKPNTSGQRSGYRNFRGVQQGDDIPAELLGGPGRKGRVEVSRHREQCAYDIIRLEVVGVDQRTQQLVGGGENLACIVSSDGCGSPDTMKAGWRRHER